MAIVVLLMLQPRPVSISLDAIILVLVGVLLLAMALGDRPAPCLPANARTSQTSSMHSSSTEPLPGLDALLSALPFPAALASPDGQPLSINTEATHWLEDGFLPRLAAPLRALALRVADDWASEAVQVTLVEGQPPLRLKASPLLRHTHHPGWGAAIAMHGVLLLAPQVSLASVWISPGW